MSNIDFQEEVSKRLNIFRLNDLQKSGLNYERIYLDGYRDSKNGWEVPVIDPFSGKELFCRTRLDSPGAEMPKYIQPKGVGLVPFYPYRDDWLEIAQDTSQSIIWLEGEKKASKLSQESFTAISMPGVSAYGSVKFLESISQFNWKNRKTYICFDNDIRTKPQVKAALEDFAKILYRKGARVLEIELPDKLVMSDRGDYSND